ncbi:MAG: SPOR domain-containing protein [Alistipes onderdonkii]
MVEVTEMVFRKVYIVLCAALLAAGDLCAQQVRVEPRIAGLEGNREYMSLLEQDAQLQIREAAIVNAVERARQQLREDPANRQRDSQEILQLESRIFEVRNAKGRLIDKINTIEQEWVLANLNGAAQQPAEPVAESPAGAIPDSLKVRNLVFNYFREQLPEADYAFRAGRRGWAGRRGLCEPLFRQLRDDPRTGRGLCRGADRAEAGEIYDRYNTLQGFNRVLADSLAEAWNYIADNKGYAYGYLMDKLGQDAILAREEERLSGAARELSALRGEVASDAVADYFLRKKVLVGYETAVAGLLGLTSARDSLRGVAAQLDGIDFRLPRIDVAQRYFLDYDSIAFSATPKYSYQHPIPECRVYEHGTIYRILLGTFNTKRAVSTFRGAYPLSYLVGEDKKWCYYAGGFATREEAEAAQKLLKSKGFVRPEIVVWTDGAYRNLSRDPEAQQIAYRVEITGTEALPDVVKTVITEAAEGCELSRVGQQLFVVGMFDDKAVADRVAAAIIQADPSLEIKVAEIAE